VANTFIYGPKDGAPVPAILWILPSIELLETTKDGKFVHRYTLNDEDNNYHYVGVVREENND